MRSIKLHVRFLSSWKDNLVSTDWLLSNMSTVKLLDTSYTLDKSRNPFKEYTSEHIPSSSFFDIDLISNKSINLPHMFPTSSILQSSMRGMGINSKDHVVLYDTAGIFSAPRVWFTLRMFGFEKISILDGGYKKWKLEGKPIESGQYSPVQNNNKQESLCDYSQDMVVTATDVLQSLNTNSLNIIDARSTGRFYGKEAEPRIGLRPGHIPNSISLPFNNLLLKKDNYTYYKPIQDIKKEFVSVGVDINSKTPIVLSCGSGLTACILAFGLHLCGRQEIGSIKIYDGSWTEWGDIKNKHLPVDIL